MRAAVAASLAGLVLALSAAPMLAQPAQPAPAQPAPAVTFQDLLLKEAADKVNSGIAERRVEQQLREAQLAQGIREDKHFTMTLYKQAVLDVVLTVLVIVIVGAGLWMSYLQIKTDTSPTSFKVSREGLEMSSSVIGLFVLLASMFFFYVYIDKVYDIRRVGRGEAAPAAPPRAPPQAAPAPVPAAPEPGPTVPTPAPTAPPP